MVYPFARIGVALLFLCGFLQPFPNVHPSSPDTCVKDNAFLKAFPLENKKEVLFGLTKDCSETGEPFWAIEFLFKEPSGAELKTRVKIHLRVDASRSEPARRLAEAKELSPAKISLLKGRIADRAAELPMGTTDDRELNRLLLRML
jgi:hypothetical protein